jgi:hypothetical protein|tara:strand:- start:262 stop:522 length:261 start_codon:yes stop_codon:yes gene_type:complete
MSKWKEEIKKTAGRPSSGLSHNELSKKSKAKKQTKNITITGNELLERFRDYKNHESILNGFEVTNTQFLSVLLRLWLCERGKSNET